MFFVHRHRLCALFIENNGSVWLILFVMFRIVFIFNMSFKTFKKGGKHNWYMKLFLEQLYFNFTPSREYDVDFFYFRLTLTWQPLREKTVLELQICGFRSHVIQKRDFVSSRCIMRSDTQSIHPLRLTRTRRHRNVEAPITTGLKAQPYQIREWRVTYACVQQIDFDAEISGSKLNDTPAESNSAKHRLLRL